MDKGKREKMQSYVNFLKECLYSGYLAFNEIGAPLHGLLKAPSGHGKTHMLKSFAEQNEGVYISSGEDLTSNQFRQLIGSLPRYYLVIFDDLRFRDDRTKKTILSLLTSLADSEYSLKQECADDYVELRGSIIVSMNNDQIANSIKTMKTLGFHTRYWTYEFFIPWGGFDKIIQHRIPKIETLHLDIEKFKYSDHPLPAKFSRYGRDFRSISHTTKIFSIGKTLGFTDEEIKMILTHSTKETLDLGDEKGK